MYTAAAALPIVCECVLRTHRHQSGEEADGTPVVAVLFPFFYSLSVSHKTQQSRIEKRKEQQQQCQLIAQRFTANTHTHKCERTTVSPKCHTGEEAEREGRKRKGIKIVEDQEKKKEQVKILQRQQPQCDKLPKTAKVIGSARTSAAAAEN